MRDFLMAPIIDELLNKSLQSYIVLPTKDTREETFGYRYRDLSPIIVAKNGCRCCSGNLPSLKSDTGYTRPGTGTFHSL